MRGAWRGAPEAFESDRLLNLFDGRWQRVGRPGYHVNPVDGTSIQGPPQVDRDTAAAAVDAAERQHADWGKVELDERKERVTAAVDMMAAHRDLLALLLVWEIGKPWRLACADVDRGLDGVRWYVEEIDRQVEGRRPPTRPGVEHRQLELPRQRAGARRAGPGAGRQCRRREDAEPGRLPLPDADARLHGPHGPAHDPAVGCGLQARRRADQQRGHRALALAEAIGIVLPEGPYETLAGFVQTQLGRVPSVGDSLEAHGHRFTVVEMDGRRVARVRVAPPTPTPDDLRHPPARWSHRSGDRCVRPRLAGSSAPWHSR